MTAFRASVLAVALSLAAIGQGALAASVNPFSSFWTLGDSLSDSGNLYAATGGAEPVSPPYYAGRFSNGPVWAEHVAGTFAAQGHPAGNFAFGGANAETNADAIPDLAAQIGFFAASASPFLGDRPLASLWFGANDLLSNGIPNGDAAAVGRRAARTVSAGALSLASLGVHDVMIFNLPDLGKVPRFALGDAEARRQATLGSRAFNKTLDKQITGLRRSGVNVIKVDMAALFEDLLSDPEKFGVSDVTNPCLLPGQLPCSAEEAMQRAFFDTIHPNAVVHGAIGEVALAEIAAVPLPAPVALLGAGILALVLVRRRTAAA